MFGLSGRVPNVSANCCNKWGKYLQSIVAGSTYKVELWVRSKTTFTLSVAFTSSDGTTVLAQSHLRYRLISINHLIESTSSRAGCSICTSLSESINLVAVRWLKNVLIASMGYCKCGVTQCGSKWGMEQAVSGGSSHIYRPQCSVGVNERYSRGFLGGSSIRIAHRYLQGTKRKLNFQVGSIS